MADFKTETHNEGEEPFVILWDKREVYEAKIAPLMRHLYSLCRANDIPFVATAQVAAGEGDRICQSSYVFVPGFGSTHLRELALQVAPEEVAKQILDQVSAKPTEENDKQE